MKKNIRLTVAYDGKAYLGWQKTPTGPSVEETLQCAIEKILQEPITLQAASRTDAGVHAKGQVVNFFSSKVDEPLERFCHSLNSVLPKDIAVNDAVIMPEAFHPTLDCVGKEYRYSICYGPIQSPFHREYSWHYPYGIDVQLMQEAKNVFVGEKNFAAFCNTKKNAKYQHHTREISNIEINELPNERLEIRIEGNHFLYKMVRNIVGTLVYIGNGKITMQQLSSIFEKEKRALAGVTAPAHGLCLHRVIY